MSNSRMGSGHCRWLAPLLKEGLSWAVFLLWIALGALATAIFGSVPVGWSWVVEWPKAFGFGLLGLTSVLASILALRNRRQAARLFLLAAPVMAGCFAWWQRLGRYDGTFSFRKFTLVFAGTAALLIVPGLFWLATGRWGWRPLITRREIPGVSPRQPFILNLSLFSFLIVVCAFGSLCFPIAEPDCGGRPPVSVQTSPKQAVFTGKVLWVARPPFSELQYGALLRGERVYWGLPRWMTGLVFIRGYFRGTDAGREYFVDAYRSEGALTRFLPIVEHYPCCHTVPISDAEVDLRVLQDGTSKSGARIIGRVYSFQSDRPGERSVPGVTVMVIGPAGSLSTITDKSGIYDFRDLPPGHYSIRVGPNEHGWVDLKPGVVSGSDLWLPHEQAVR